ncbi:carbohydrate esterase family 12 protein [Exserohilum turcica Et28A]|uniref:Carbohydrate esterase family 12 protein n=1 Tax=Exserohilum turcicum (strain 28A) TaxID=671987 RepID=R0JZ16_EXST2|nr:carbohydrate esterase family 12 protein [Exserohilum turcica Et28A]EOA82694.1 carbohydrate esterase family 12 protein [Exserohilum turcica Et28A]
MYSSSVISVLALAATAVGAPTVYLAGDSTMARGNSLITGWGVYLPYSLTVNVVNKAIGGRSARSFTDEGRFDEIANLVQPGDIVVIEFGHNDGGSLHQGDNGRTPCAGTGDETCQSTYNGKQVTVHTFNWYMKQAGQQMIAKGAKVIVSSQTTNNPWESGSFVYGSGGRFVGYAKDVAAALGSNATYVDHGLYSANMWKLLGKDETDSLFVQGHTHTNAVGADYVAGSFVKALACAGGSFLQGSIKNATDSITGTCL